ncbi:MAG TPA: flagellar filament capping protein FliD [Kofleriaceae bacterium]|nr:flagellar filament capping protein FliD [Kofleriaceae bacterium]
MTISFSGIATGIDTESLVNQLVAVEKQGAVALQRRKSDAGTRKSVVSSLVSKLQALKAAAAAVNTPSEVRALTARSSDETKVKVTSSGAANPAQLAIHVDTLARAQTNVSTLFPSSDGAVPKVPGAGQLGIKVGGADQVVVEFTSLDTLADVASRINDTVTGAHAEVVNTGNGFQLAVSSNETGKTNELAFSEGGTSLGFLAEGSLKSPAQDASFTLNGIAITRSSNTIGDVASGVTIELLDTHDVGEVDTRLTVASDPAGTEAKIKSLVDAFNDLAGAVSGQLTYSEGGSGTNTLFGDSTTRSLQRALSDIVTHSYAHGDSEDGVSLGQLGISLGRDGKLTIDSAKLSDAVGTDPTAIEDVIAGTDGLAVSIDKLVSAYTRTGDGFFTAKTDSLTREMRGYDDTIDRIEKRADALGDQLRAQFNSLETLMSNMKSQQSALSALLG